MGVINLPTGIVTNPMFFILAFFMMFGDNWTAFGIVLVVSFVLTLDSWLILNLIFKK